MDRVKIERQPLDLVQTMLQVDPLNSNLIQEERILMGNLIRVSKVEEALQRKKSRE